MDNIFFNDVNLRLNILEILTLEIVAVKRTEKKEIVCSI